MRRSALVAALTTVLLGLAIALAGSALAAPMPVSHGGLAPAGTDGHEWIGMAPEGADTNGHGWAN